MATYTLLLQLAAPLQSWGADSKFETRRTNKEPTKSGVVGLVAAALGIQRDEDDKIQKLASLKFGVRVDKEGKLLKDFHIVQTEKKNYVTNRYYLQDAVFIAGFESDNKEELEEIYEALKCPAYPIFLGRRACPPARKVPLGIFSGTLKENLETYPPAYEKARELRVVIDAESGNVCRDLPISFNPNDRKHGFRAFKEYVIPVKQPGEHDPMAELDDI